ncbi:MAG: M48 family metallopeptidase [candidate division KSB1 bacterium]|nr:M48 family metallopeptidase [candidate division KSB1 bacterium]
MNRPDILHFSLPGGNIFISRGLIELTETDCELAAVIAHEAVHSSHRHSVQQVADKYAYALAAQKIVGDNPEIIKTVLESLFTRDTILDYGKKLEFSADERALLYMQQAGYDPDGLMRLLTKIDELYDSREFLMKHLHRTHQLPGKRLKKLPEARGPLPQPSTGYSLMRRMLERIPE